MGQPGSGLLCPSPAWIFLSRAGPHLLPFKSRRAAIGSEGPGQAWCVCVCVCNVYFNRRCLVCLRESAAQPGQCGHIKEAGSPSDGWAKEP